MICPSTFMTKIINLHIFGRSNNVASRSCRLVSFFLFTQIHTNNYCLFTRSHHDIKSHCRSSHHLIKVINVGSISLANLRYILCLSIRFHMINFRFSTNYITASYIYKYILYISEEKKSLKFKNFVFVLR